MELNEDQLATVKTVFAEMGFNPGGDVTADVIKDWITTKAVKVEPEVPAPTHTVTVNPTVRISAFSGEEKDAPYDVWRYEVRALMGTHKEEEVAEALRRSLRGKASKVAMNVGPRAGVIEVIAKMDSIFGAVEKGETLLAKFYSARQKEGEDVSTWSCRLEDILNKAVQQGDVQQRNAEKMLRTMFWTGLRREIKSLTGHKYDTIDQFDELRVAIRQVERDLKERDEEVTPGKAADKTKPVAHMAAATDELKEVKGLIQQLTTEVADLKKSQEKFTSKSGQDKRKNGNGSQRRQKKEHQPWYQANGVQSQQQSQQQSNSQPWSYNQGKLQQPQALGNAQPQQQQGYEPQCYRCGQYGHIKLGCRANIDHHWSGLNANQSAM